MQPNLWNHVLERLEKRINRPSFNTWLRPTSLLSIAQRDIRIGVPDEVFVYWLGEYYVNAITDTLTELLGFQPEIAFVVLDEEDAGNPPPEPVASPLLAPQVTPKQLPLPLAKLAAAPTPFVREPADSYALANFRSSSPLSGTLNPRYTFDAYVVGNSNRFAHTAALSVAEQMAVNYNPLFIYGGVGLGKTHLLHAIGNYVAAARRTDRILYLSAEQFMNELIMSIREDRMAPFRDKYRHIDLLLIDDIQFIARKERTQEEFFHTFNTLYHDRKQIVLTSDCPPKNIPTIAEQLRSRFEWGLIADIRKPDLDTRIQILKQKAASQQVALPDDVAIYIASHVKANIRELEGALTKMRAYLAFNQQALTLDLAQKVLHDIFAVTSKKVTVELVQQVVANHYQIELAAMRSHERSRDITLPRQIAMYLARELTNRSLPEIARDFGGRDHTTVLHACKKVERIQEQDLAVRKSILHIRDLIRN